MGCFVWRNLKMPPAPPVSQPACDRSGYMTPMCCEQDIKLENALLDRAAPRALLKLCDFGYSVRNEASPSGPVACHRAVGTPDYMVSDPPVYSLRDVLAHVCLGHKRCAAGVPNLSMDPESVFQLPNLRRQSCC